MRRALVLVSSLLFADVLSGQESIRWKPWSEDTKTGRAVRFAPPLQRRSLTTFHAALEFAAIPSSEDLQALQLRGVVLLGRLSERAYVARAPESFLPDGTSITWSGVLAAEDKLSPLLHVRGRPDRLSHYLIEFYPDVDMGDARSIALQSGARVIDNPDLSGSNLLVAATAGQIATLAQWDEVAYIFPASLDLVRGIPVHACAGALTSEGALSQGVPAIGDGWDGPGLNATTLGYALASITEKLPAADAEAEILRALQEWSRYARITFSPASSPTSTRTLTVLFASAAHRDPYPFDGPGKTIAHTYYPYPLNSESLAGDLHFDADEPWRIGANTDLFSVALHEAGHALGLGHSDNPGDVMYPYYKRVSSLAPGDIAGIQKLYAAADAPPAEPALSVAPLSIFVSEAPAAVTAASVTLRGTVAGGSGVAGVIWRNDAMSGAAEGSSTWTAEVPLLPGSNTIVLTAFDAQQNTATATVTIVRETEPDAIGLGAAD